MSVSPSSLLLAGLGNIGSPLAGLLARLEPDRLVLVDRDHVESKNVRAQDFSPEDVGQFKAEVVARRLARHFPGLIIEAHCCDLEDLPHGVAEVDLVLGALDSRRARQILVTELALPLGVPVIDGGVGEEQRGRVQVFVPGEAAACLECGWSQEDYRQLNQEYSCVPGGSASAPPTAAPAFLGTAVASLMAAEAARFLGGEAPAESCEIAFDLLHRRHLVSRLRHNPRCRARHSRPRDIVSLGVPFEQATAGQLVERIRSRVDPQTPLHVECRRGVMPGEGFRSGRLLDFDRLQREASVSLHQLGFLPRDLIRVQTRGDSFLVRLF